MQGSALPEPASGLGHRRKRQRQEGQSVPPDPAEGIGQPSASPPTPLPGWQEPRFAGLSATCQPSDSGGQPDARQGYAACGAGQHADVPSKPAQSGRLPTGIENIPPAGLPSSTANEDDHPSIRSHQPAMISTSSEPVPDPPHGPFPLEDICAGDVMDEVGTACRSMDNVGPDSEPAAPLQAQSSARAESLPGASGHHSHQRSQPSQAEPQSRHHVDLPPAPLGKGNARQSKAAQPRAKAVAINLSLARL
ncbi:hypothetical protein WJX73_003953 [Symbiochloris irregularis]|uniref:Uncharacterized protein n=1 Tax=Symbiochloris irregularis TaxID=706552 RepID=A0AAW1NQP4_9CHLO